MKKVIACLLAGLFLLGAGCSRDMNWVISNEPSIMGIVEEIGPDFVLIRVTKADELPSAVGGQARVDKETRLQDCKFSANVGDEVVVYYDSYKGLADALNVEIHNVHGYCLVTPIEREPEGSK